MRFEIIIALVSFLISLFVFFFQRFKSSYSKEFIQIRLKDYEKTIQVPKDRSREENIILKETILDNFQKAIQNIESHTEAILGTSGTFHLKLNDCNGSAAEVSSIHNFSVLKNYSGIISDTIKASGEIHDFNISSSNSSKIYNQKDGSMSYIKYDVYMNNLIKGQEFKIQTNYKLKNTFLDAEEYWHFKFNNNFKQFQIQIEFPSKCKPKNIKLKKFSGFEVKDAFIFSEKETNHKSVLYTFNISDAKIDDDYLLEWN
ncbi:hypothetical protein A8B79_02375 [Balneola sp. EhC07]|uniref:hypothetical protein n=1 Tax=Balneola sp. EhC07 TaxID=1849360 RepID=UPI0007F41612|nr:hypothetical protein [Balneola sp. EhC07]OAN62417.1 hypothetical protein A8B79_02375 [Balneola sp. EhC07]